MAREVQARAPEGWEIVALGRDAADFTNPLATLAALKRARPEAVINAVAYTAVDRAEEDEALAQQVNGATPGLLAAECAAMGVPFVHLSTDYVFAGSGVAPYAPADATAPQNAYGRSKLAGEEAVRAAGGPHVILRTSWVFSSHGANFVKTMLRLGAERDRLTIVADQIGGPTPARAIAAACLRIAERLYKDAGQSGTYHFSGIPEVSWAEFAREIFAQAGISCEVVDIPTSDYPTPAQRPLNSRLDCRATETVFGIARPDWRVGLAEVLDDLKERQR
ncbi:dTDP-4-dehydrorhamnose reductase [Roseovarius nubinhibens ISM]|uniref:dTDP-4-dehydrorhamnose reductase n=1 Tax=Roseovarius nubinhibens (strain ATCC BAA-591 / DSM 15170 / ISM) TaxID=89187 RepID=A3SJ64_ROSNI|nr:dTDP-4-dehydrorhamnose reductase [Roseovarius nubinhibens ISM]